MPKIASSPQCRPIPDDEPEDDVLEQREEVPYGDDDQ